ncbi:DUF192 domain-containing protein [Sphingomonas sp. ABOLG]|jgi:uncharacterized membrane protein (UPF0127 family)|uniref:DUF192 domain-containing protein n=1 Tax=Sphingomonas olei TaxID=1886787 RepID=A0ABY2QQ33_9SPHN|nr:MULTISPECIES: DUF192 domain-containing protein [Sphingomonas]RSV18577.1 DUF192 domain-containing protein [Sphingomonas sp. ABOLG]THG42217.1 DUF192 domain-containing protein [Sphingomonas olei]
MKLLAMASLAFLLGAAACTGRDAAATASDERAKAPLTEVTIASANGRHVFRVEVADTPEKQQRGLMYRTDIPKDGGMLFAPYPPDGGGPREASFWMKNTPSPLDIIFIRPDGTIARIAENTVPFSEAQVPSGEPVSAVLELNGGRSAELGIAEGDKVSWNK